ncbi:Sphingomyelin phosphodiesterase [Entamoeba marina]
MSSNKSLHFRIVLLGSGSVGKSALATRYVKNTFISRYDPTIEETFSKTIDCEGKVVQLEIYDTAGTEQFRTLQDLYMKEGDAFILVFALNSIATFQDLESIHQHIIDVKKSMSKTDVPIVLAGNKCDLDERNVNVDDVNAFATERKCTYMETSAKTQKNVDEVFMHLTKQLVENAPKKKSGGCAIL